MAITITKNKSDVPVLGEQPWMIECLSTDTKPTVGVPNASKCLEMDTGKVFDFDADNKVYYEL